MEKILFRKRIIKAGIIWSVINVIDIIACYSNLLEMFEKGMIDKIAFNETIVTGDFHSILQYGVVYMFAFLIGVGYILGNERVEKIVRYEQRKKFYLERVKKVCIVVLLFSFIHEITSIIFILIYGDYSLLIRHNWVEGIVCQIIVSFMYYLITFFVLTIICAKWKKSTGIIYTVIIMAVQYYVSTKFLPFIYMPVKDVGILAEICSGTCSYMQGTIILMRLMLVTVILGNMCLKMKDREDVL